MLINILSNAIDAIRSRLVELPNLVGKITISTNQTANETSILIQDNGVGIPEELLQRIFDPFYTTKEVGAGTGLGLSISYGIIEQHGGRIEVDSQVKEGANFKIYLPLRTENKNESPMS